MKLYSIILIIISIIACIFISFYAVDKRYIGMDQVQHFYDMKKWYDSNKLPTTGTRFIASEIINGEITTPRVPGGAYYIFYTLFYKLSNENLLNARIINLIFNLIILIVFLFWFYRKFGIFITSIMSALILCNPYVILAITDFWNPNITLIFSFLFFIFLFEYINNDNKKIKQISSIFIFPILALMAQGHFVVFFSMVPTIIVYLIIRFKTTKHYFLYWSIGVFIAFLLYLPYLVSEFQNGFNNLKLAMNIRDGLNRIPFPQIYALLIFPTNEMSSMIGTRFGSVYYFWTKNGIYFYGLIFLILSVLISVFLFFNSIFIVIKNKNIDDKLTRTVVEMFYVFLMFIPITILSFIIFRSKPGTFHYLYSAFSISFITYILFFKFYENNFNNKKKLVISIFFILNVFAVSGEMYRYFYLFQEPRSEEALYAVGNFIKDDSQGKKIAIYDSFSGIVHKQFEDIFKIYFTNMNLNISKSPDILYAIRDDILINNWDDNRNNREMEYLINNNAIELTNIAGYTIFKFPNVPD
ncbi:hypothetical protein [Brachyspira sp. SAP_772]|uniref:hypothetical protein n=1 Tax=Brachyspira sp. SAP_772 TaxID=2608385 RepID=UPI0012F528BF|nr:hypothetical protein [Brachyspira sp. SAP_772]